MRNLKSMTVILVLAVAGMALAVPTQYATNGHFYEAIQVGGLDYNQAKAAAATHTFMGRAGHLPTFADLPYGVAQGENEWVKANIFVPAKTGGFWGYWFGLESPGANTDFRWATGEYFRDSGVATHYSDWGYTAGSTNHGVFYHSDHDQWQNGPKSYTHTGLGYLVEYDIPTYNAANGHYYEVVEAGEAGFVDEDGVGMSYNDAKADAASRSWMGATGHLISVNDAAEQAFMAGLIGPFDGLPKPAFYFIGLEHAAGTTDFEWASGESYNDGVDYDNWDGANPDAGATDVGTFMEANDGTNWEWNDIDKTYTDSPYPLSNRFRGYVVEYDVVASLLGDANLDGLVSADDYASVQANFGNTGAAGGGLLGDANHDGLVSADDYASVQANFGNTSGGMSAVPEPATLGLLAIGLIAVLRRKSR